MDFAMATCSAVKIRERPILFSGQMVKAILDGRKTQTRRVMREQPSKVEESSDWWESADGSGQVGATYEFSGSRPAKWFFFDDDLVNGRIEYLRPGVGKRPTKRQALSAGRWHTQFGRQPKWSESEVAGLCPYGEPGDRLWVRETWAGSKKAPKIQVAYKADGMCVGVGGDGNGGWMGVFHGWLFPDVQDKGPSIGRTLYGPWKPSIHMPRPFSRISLEVTDVRVQRVQEITDEDAIAEGAQCAGVPASLTNRGAFAKLWDQINGKRGFGWDENPWVWAVTFKVADGDR